MKYITLALLAALAVLHYQLWLHKGGLHSQHAEIRHKAEIMQRQNARLRADNRALKAEVDDLQNGYEAVSETARFQMGYIQDGERFYLTGSDD